jgi:hypothetical protein
VRRRVAGACDYRVRVNRKRAEDAVIGVFDSFLAADRVRLMAREYQREYTRLLRESEARAIELPREVQALDARIARLRERQRVGDPDVTADDLQTVIDRVVTERARLDAAAPAAVQLAKVVAMLPDVAERCREQARPRRRPRSSAQGARRASQALWADRD